jgi:hypothetical protein
MLGCHGAHSLTDPLEQEDERIGTALLRGPVLIGAGGHGFCVDAVRRVADGEPMLSPTVTRQLIAHVAEVARPASAGSDDRTERRPMSRVMVGGPSFDIAG